PHRPVVDRWQAPAVSWPVAGSGIAELRAASSRPAPGKVDRWPLAAARVRAGSLPVWVGHPAGVDPSSGPSQVRVDLASRSVATAAGVNGLLLSAQATTGSTGSGSTQLTVDYSSIAGAFGGDWASRLHLVTLPTCALTKPTSAA